MKELVGIDVGTRSIKGLVGISDKKLKITGFSVREHPTRAMFDGQIHNVPQVADSIKFVKEALEKKMKIKITEAATAVAGRVLLTKRGRSQIEFPLFTLITESYVNSLEWNAVYSARNLLQSENEMETWDYICVGYSVTRYSLDGVQVESLLGQRGRFISCEVIATFLPRIVIDALVSAFDYAGLKVALMTLEPIAAMDLVVSPDLRRLNIALVDIGAGTSDIAISKDGTVLGYGMVPFAGDEVTELIMKEFLVDFSTAETIKKSRGDFSFKDILGKTHNIKEGMLLEVIDPAVESIALKIGGKILELNEKPPEVVICIGGGSLTPYLKEKLSGILNIPEDRIAIKGGDSLDVSLGKRLGGPEWITPVGILNAYQNRRGFIPIEVWLNGEKIRILDTGIITVRDLILSSGFSPWLIYGEPGRGISVEVNGDIKIFSGEKGKPAIIAVNGNRASLDTRISMGDEVKIIPGERGLDAMISIEDLMNTIEAPRVRVNGREYELPVDVLIDGRPASRNTIIYDRAKIELKSKISLYRFLKSIDIHPESQILRYRLNGAEHTFKWNPAVIYLNGRIITEDITLNPGDIIEIQTNPFPAVRDVLGKDLGENFSMSIKVNGEELKLNYGKVLTFNGKEISPDEPFVEGDYNTTSVYQPILADVLTCISLGDDAQIRDILLNGEEASFSSPLKDGDQIEIRWR
mgnify:FL=1